MKRADRNQAIRWAKATRPPEPYTVAEALSLARHLKYVPIPKPDDPTPSREEALELIWEEARTCGFNWLTGACAIAALAEDLGL